MKIESLSGEALLEFKNELILHSNFRGMNPKKSRFLRKFADTCEELIRKEGKFLATDIGKIIDVFREKREIEKNEAKNLFNSLTKLFDRFYKKESGYGK